MKVHFFSQHVLAGACALAGLVGMAHAQDTVTITGRPILEANRVDGFGSLSTEVGEAQLRDLNALDLPAALRRTPGVQISRFNPVGSFGGDEGGAVFVRGFGASRPGSEIKTYVDGIPFYSGIWNHPLTDLLPVQGMQRISVHKGPQPQVSGNNFAAIDLVPRRARAEGLAADVRLSGGSFDTALEQAALQWRRGDLDLSLAQGHAESDGHRGNASGRLDSVLLRAGWRLNPQWELGATGLWSENKVSDPGQRNDPSTRTGRFDTRGTLAALSLSHTHGDWLGRVQLYANEGQGFWHDNPNGADTFSPFGLSGLRWREEMQPWAGGQLVAGLDIERLRGSVSFNGFTAFSGQGLRLSSPYVALAHTLHAGGWQITPSGGVRLYRHNVFGSSSAPHLGVVAAMDKTLQLHLNAARGLNHPGLDAPLLNAIVPPLAATPDGWRELNPERLDHVEAGLAWTPAAGTALDLALFNDRLSDRYVFAFPPAVAAPQFTNLGRYTVKGLEATLNQDVGAGLALFAGLTLLDANRADLPYLPKRALTLGANWRSGPWRVSADAQGQAGMLTLNRARADGTSNSQRVGGFGVLHLRTAYALPALGPRGEVFLAVENLTDRRYEFRPGYPMPGRSGQVGLNFSL